MLLGRYIDKQPPDWLAHMVVDVWLAFCPLLDSISGIKSRIPDGKDNKRRVGSGSPKTVLGITVVWNAQSRPDFFCVRYSYMGEITRLDR